MASNLHLQQNVMTRYLTRVDCCNLENISMYLIHRFFIMIHRIHRYMLAMHQMMQYIDV
jgi:hypothetical protein